MTRDRQVGWCSGIFLPLLPPPLHESRVVFVFSHRSSVQRHEGPAALIIADTPGSMGEDGAVSVSFI